jgi:hypothetical protein
MVRNTATPPGARAPKNNSNSPPSDGDALRRRYSVIARIGAEPVPVQIIAFVLLCYALLCDF